MRCIVEFSTIIALVRLLDVLIGAPTRVLPISRGFGAFFSARLNGFVKVDV